MVEHLIGNEEVHSSILCGSTILLTIVGVEFQAADAGLGYLITYGGQIIQMNLVMTAIVVLAAISSVLFVLIQAAEATVLRRHGALR